jgi:ribonuclease P protein component
VVSRKVHKSAVVRNRIRRRIYEIVRRADAQPVSGTDLVFTVFSDQLAELPAPKLERAILELLEKINAPARPEKGSPTAVKRAIVKPDNFKKV